jgi:hypothetical protein
VIVLHRRGGSLEFIVDDFEPLNGDFGGLGLGPEQWRDLGCPDTLELTGPRNPYRDPDPHPPSFESIRNIDGDDVCTVDGKQFLVTQRRQVQCLDCGSIIAGPVIVNAVASTAELATRMRAHIPYCEGFPDAPTT